MYRVYQLRSACGRTYFGLSIDVAGRLRQHNAGQSRWTSGYRPWVVVWTSRPLPLSEARKLENLLKRQKGGDGLSAILLDYAGS